MRQKKNSTKNELMNPIFIEDVECRSWFNTNSNGRRYDVQS